MEAVAVLGSVDVVVRYAPEYAGQVDDATGKRVLAVLRSSSNNWQSLRGVRSEGGDLVVSGLEGSRIEVLLPDRKAIHTIRSLSSGSMTVLPNVMSATGSREAKKSRVDHTGEGDLFVDYGSNVELDLWEITNQSPGKLQVAVDDFRVKKLMLQTGGSGHTQMIPSYVSTANSADLFFIDHEGAGSTCVDTPNVHAAQLTMGTFASGGAVFASTGRCVKGFFATAGSGNLDVHNVQCQDATINTLGSGDAVVHVTDHLNGSSVGSGKVTYVGDRPKVMGSKYGYTLSGPLAEPAAHALDAIDCTPFPLPSLQYEDAVGGLYGVVEGVENLVLLNLSPRRPSDPTVIDSKEKDQVQSAFHMGLWVPIYAFALGLFLLRLNRRLHQRRVPEVVLVDAEASYGSVDWKN